MNFISPAEVFGVDGITIVVVVVLVLFGSTRIPKLARSLGSAQKEFKKGIGEGAADGSGSSSGLGVAVPDSAIPPAATSVAAGGHGYGSPGATP